MAENDCFSKFFIKSEWDELSANDRLMVKLMFIDYFVRRSKAKDDEEVEKPAFMVRYDQRRAKLMEERRKELAKQGKLQSKRKSQEKSDGVDGLLRGFTELEITESRKNILPLKKLVKKLRQEFDSSDSDLSESRMYKRKQRPRRNRKRVNYAEVDEPDFDDYIYCDICDSYSERYCPVHGPLLVIPNRTVTEIPPGSTRAEMSCPKELQIAPSKIPGAGLGVFTRSHMPKNVRFGPYEGVITSQPKPGGYAWQVLGTVKTRTHLLDAADPHKSNWLRYVNCARRYAHQNMTTFQFHGKLYYRTIENIPPNTELLIFYGIEYAELLGIDMQSYGDKEVSSEEENKILCNSYGQTTTEDVYDEEHVGQQKDLQHQQLKTSSGGFKCDTCNRTFHKPHLLRAHQKLHQRNSSKTTVMTNSAVAGPSYHGQEESAKTKRKPSKIIFHKRSEHMRVHTGEKPYHCDKCSATFTQSGTLTRHMRVHTGEKPYHCDKSSATFTQSSNLTTHMRKHTGEKPYECSECGAKFTRRNVLNQHMRVHTGEKPYHCDKCSATFTQSSNLTTHMREHTGEKPYDCDKCSATFTQSGTLTRHMRVHTGEKPYHCDKCSATFTQSSNLTTHMRKHTGEKPYHCDKCSATFTQSSNLTTHMREHTGEKPYHCDKCSATFTQSSNLTTHMRKHTGEKPYHCDKCSATFTRSSNLTTHMREHTGEKPYECSECGAKFTRRDVLNQHMRVHTGERPYHCDKCSATFTQSSNLTTHMREHTGEKPYECSECGAKFTRRDVLNQHMRVHTGEKPYHCDKCSATFTQGSHLTTHMRVHTGEKPYHKKFTQSNGLNQHMRMRHTQ